MKNKALLCLYILEAKEKIDTLLYIDSLKNENWNFNLNTYTNNNIELFYLKLRHATELMDKEFGLRKKELSKDERFKKLFYETDKNIVHKDDDYEYEPNDLKTVIFDLQAHLDYLYNYCKDKEIILKNFKYTYYCFDSLLYRIVHPIENIRHKMERVICYLNDIEDKQDIIEFDKPEVLKSLNYRDDNFGITMSNGIVHEEEQQNNMKAVVLAQIKYNIDYGDLFENSMGAYEE